MREASLGLRPRELMACARIRVNLSWLVAIATPVKLRRTPPTASAGASFAEWMTSERAARDGFARTSG